MTFDPFGDFETRGYLRNVAKTKDLAVVQRLQHNSFLTGVDAGLAQLEARSSLTYADVLQTHKTLFEAVFPWAGEDRLTNASTIFVNKGLVLFAHPKDIRRAVGYALEKGQDKAFMAEKPGEVMGYLAYGHPFLDGNGRTIMLIHAELARRAGFSIDWSATDKDQYRSGQNALRLPLLPYPGAFLAVPEGCQRRNGTPSSRSCD
ncbi:Fic family protein [Bradyrhizobium sp. 191]|nr:Fic family protein [Bradyrhizobium sp. 191]